MGVFEEPGQAGGAPREPCSLTDALHQLAGHDGREQHLFGAANQVGHPAVSLHQQRIGVGTRQDSHRQSALYKLRRLVENGFLEFKQWRGIDTRCAKKMDLYLADCQFLAVMIWSKLF